MKLLANKNPNVWQEGDWQEISPFNVPITNAVLLIEVYDDVQIYINGESVVWATYDDREYYALAKATPELLYSIANAVNYEALWLRVEFPDTSDGEEHPLAWQWEWEHVMSFITTGKYE